MLLCVQSISCLLYTSFLLYEKVKEWNAVFFSGCCLYASRTVIMCPFREDGKQSFIIHKDVKFLL